MSQLTMLPDNVFTDAWKLREFLLAGNAKFTLRSEKSLKHYTYKIRKPGNDPVWFVSRLAADNAYRYLGCIFEDEDFIFRTSKKTAPYDHYSEAFAAFKWFWEKLDKEKRIPNNVTAWHEGKCGMCGRELTDPVSIKNGFGPDCSKLRLSRPFMYDRKSA